MNDHSVRFAHAAMLAEVDREVPRERIWNQVRGRQVVHRTFGYGRLLALVRKHSHPPYLLVHFRGEDESRKFMLESLIVSRLWISVPPALYIRWEPLWQNEEETLKSLGRKYIAEMKRVGRIERRARKRRARELMSSKERDLSGTRKAKDIYVHGWRLPGSFESSSR